MYEKERELMIDTQLRKRGVTDDRVLWAMNDIPRHEFVPPELKDMSYNDLPLPIGFNQTISQPQIVAEMIELLNPEKEDKILEIGAGSGYVTALLSRLAGKVIGMEVVPQLAEKAKKRIDELKLTNARIIQADGSEGYLAAYPYDKILVSCAVPKISEKLIEQLKAGGCIVAPVGDRMHQRLMKLTKTHDTIKMAEGAACAFVPMTGKAGF